MLRRRLRSSISADCWHRSFKFIPTDYPLEWMQGDLRLDESSAFLLATAQSTYPDVLHVNQMCYGDLQSRVPKLVVSHSDLISWSHACNKTRHFDGDWYARYVHLVSSGLAGGDVVVAPTAFQLDQIARHYGSARSSRRRHP